MTDDALGARIRQLRESKGLTREQLAERAGVSVRTIAYAESGQFRPLPLHRQAIAKALGVEDLEGMAS